MKSSTRLILLIILIVVLLQYGRILAAVGSGSFVEEKYLGEFNISLVVHQSWVEQKFNTSWYDCGAEYKFWSDSDADEFVRANHEYLYSLYTRFPKNVMRSDLFRYLVVYTFGGVWSDIDTICLKPVQKWYNDYPSAKVIIGVELDASDVPFHIDYLSVRLQFCQWTFAAGKQHPMLKYVIETIVKRYNSSSIEELSKSRVHDVTGPTIWTDAILKYFKEAVSDGLYTWHQFRYLKKPMLVGDVLVLPTTAFAPDNTGMGGKGIEDEGSFVQHLFQGSWHKKRY